jgi:ParB family chromosome partitioning protein
MTRRALGKGLSALLGEARPEQDQLIEVDIDLIEPNEEQPRTRFRQDKLEELAQSILANGIIQPLVVRRRGLRYQLISGERRWRAAQLAGLVKVPVIVRDVSDDQMLEFSLVENIQREDLNPIEEAKAFQRLIEDLRLTQEEIAQRVGRDRTSVTNYLRLLKLPKDIQELVEDDKISMGHARALLGLDSPQLQQKLAHEIVTKGLSVREIERSVQRANRAGVKKFEGRSIHSVITVDANVRAAVEKLRQRLNTQVRLVTTATGGRLEIEFYSDSDFDRIYQMIMQKGEWSREAS